MFGIFKKWSILRAFKLDRQYLGQQPQISHMNLVRVYSLCTNSAFWESCSCFNYFIYCSSVLLFINTLIFVFNATRFVSLDRPPLFYVHLHKSHLNSDLRIYSFLFSQIIALNALVFFLNLLIRFHLPLLQSGVLIGGQTISKCAEIQPISRYFLMTCNCTFPK